MIASSALATDRIDRDERSVRPPTPTTIAAVAERFLPGWRQLAEPLHYTLVQAENASPTLQVRAGTCYAAAAISNSIQDIDIRIRVDGRIVAQDVLFDAYPVAQWCARADTTVTVELRAFLGAGTAQLAFFEDPESARRTDGPLDELSNRLDQHIARSASRWTPVGDQWRTMYDQPGISSLQITPSGDVCYTVVAVGVSTVRDIDLSARYPDGSERSHDVADNATPLVVVCPDSTEPFDVRVAVTLGHGAVAARVLSRPR